MTSIPAIPAEKELNRVYCANLRKARQGNRPYHWFGLLLLQPTPYGTTAIGEMYSLWKRQASARWIPLWQLPRQVPRC